MERRCPFGQVLQCMKGTQNPVCQCEDEIRSSSESEKTGKNLNER